MRWSGWPLTIMAAIVSIVISLFLFQYGFFFFFLPLVFVPFIRFFRISKKMCPMCGLASNGNYCPRCGTKL
ncbi:MAG: hypothetical protein AB1608_08250 [Thermoproteota archaeon]